MVEKVLLVHREKHIFWTLVALIFALACFYIYSVNATIRNVVLRQHIENQAATLSLSISNEEFQYIGMKNNVTSELARSLGFKEVTPKIFVSRDGGASVAFLH